MAGAGAGALTALVAGGYSAFGAGPMRPSVSAALPGEPLPAVTRVHSATPSSASSSAVSSGAGSDETDRGDGELQRSPSSQSASATASPSTAASATATSPAPTPSMPENAAPLPPLNVADGSRTSAQDGTFVSGNGLCLDLNGAVPTDDNYIRVFDCNGTAAQRWTLGTDGKLQVMGKCALLVDDGTVRITSCDDRRSAQWRYSGADQLINVANGRCLTDPSNGSRPGTGVIVANCTGYSHQRWQLR